MANVLESSVNMQMFNNAYEEFRNKDESFFDFTVRMALERAVILLIEKEAVEKQAEEEVKADKAFADLVGQKHIDSFFDKYAKDDNGHVVLRPLNMNAEITEEAKEKTKHLDYNSMYPDFEKSEKDCMWEDRE